MKIHRFLLIMVLALVPSFIQAAEFVIAEGEQFRPLDDKGWAVTHQENSWASHTYGGAWSSHGGLLGAPADSVGSVAVQSITVPVNGTYRVWSRYQSPPYFNFTHRIEVHQNGKVVYSELYGKKKNLRIYSFNTKSDQLWWSWGVDHDAAEAPSDSFAKLKAGAAEVRLVTVKMEKPAGDPMVDLVALTTDLTDAGTGPPKAIFTMQAMAVSELYVRFKNRTRQPAQMSISKKMGHYQPVGYSGFANRMIPEGKVAPGQWSQWFNIAPWLVLMHEEQLEISLPGASGFELQVSRDKDGKDLCGDMRIGGANGTIVIPVDITWKKGSRVNTAREYINKIHELAKTEWRTANSGRKPRELLYFGAVTIPELKDVLGFNTNLPDRYDHAQVDGYHTHAHNPDEVKSFAESLQNKKNFKMLSFGDETSISYENAREMTTLARRLIGPQVETGINYSPHYPLPQYYGHQSMWIDAFKKGADGLTMFWTEDYVFSVPQLPQTLSWMFGMMHCATKYNHQLIHMYVMPHSPGQIPEYLRRNMVYCIGAGARHIDHFTVAPAGDHTENYVSWAYTDSFRVMHESIYDSAEAEPFQVNGKLRSDRVALVLSRATDDNEKEYAFNVADDPFMSQCRNAAGETTYNKQTLCRKDQQMLYVALKHAQCNLSLVTEDDIVDGYLKDYDVVYFAGEWIDQRAVPVLDRWVQDGGVLYATAGMGHLNEQGEKNGPMMKLLGLRGSSIEKNVYILRPYLEMPLVEPIGTIALDDGNRIPAIGIKQVLVTDGASVMGTWADGSAAVTRRQHGRGTVYAVGTLAGSSYIKSGLRKVPFARGGRKMVYNPTEFSAGATRLVRLGVDAVQLNREIECSNNFVEGLVIDNDAGTLVTLVNWDNQPLEDLKVRVRLQDAPRSIRSVQQQRQLKGWDFRDGVLTFNTDLEWADYILLAN